MALVSSEGKQPKTHRGLASLIGQHFVRAGRLPEEVGAAFAFALDARVEADYGRAPSVTAEEAEEVLEQARRFVEAARAWLEKSGAC